MTGGMGSEDALLLGLSVLAVGVLVFGGVTLNRRLRRRTFDFLTGDEKAHRDRMEVNAA